MSTATATFVEATRARLWRAFDWQLLLYLLLLVGFGIVMGYSANYQAVGGTSGLSQTVKTLIWTGIGLTLFFVAARTDYHWLQTFATPVYVIVLALLLATSLIGTNLFGAQMSITVAGVDFQFSEISKVLMIMVLGSFLVSRRDRIGRASCRERV